LGLPTTGLEPVPKDDVHAKQLLSRRNLTSDYQYSSEDGKIEKNVG